MSVVCDRQNRPVGRIAAFIVPPDSFNPMVLLRHELPGGLWHFDWMLARGPVGECRVAGPLLTFRVSQHPDDPVGSALDAERLPDHRAMYLTYEGEISGGRGNVIRVASGRCQIVEECEGAIRIRGCFEPSGARYLWTGSPRGGARWRFERTTTIPA